MQEMVAELARMPPWAQVALAVFAAMVVVALFGPASSHRRYRRQFDGLARALGVSPPTGRGWPVAFPVSATGRTFEIRHDFASRSGASYRGPTGYLLFIETALRGTRWEMHQVDIVRLGGLAWLMGGKRPTGDSGFDARFGIVEDGLPVRNGWLDASTRDAVARFLDETPVAGTTWIHEGRLMYVMSGPWKGVDGPFLLGLLERQALLALALERTAGVHP